VLARVKEEMESQIKPSDSHTTSGYTQNKARADGNRDTGGVSPSQKSLFAVDSILRLLAIGATLAAAIVMGTNKQTVAVPLPLGPGGASVLAPLSAKYHYSPAFIFFVVANAIACGYTVLSLIPSVAGKLAARSGAHAPASAFLLAVADLVMVALVMAGASAAAAIAYVGYKGNSHTQWLKICDNFDRFCHHTAGAIASSFVGVIILLILTVISIYSIYKRTSCAR